MKVLKFGGTSVGNSNSILQVIQILEVESSKSNLVVVVSALSGVTDLLLLAAKLASERNDQFIEILNEVEKKHIEIVNDFFKDDFQIECVHWINTNIQEIVNVCKGIYTLGELSMRSKDRIASCGEWMSSYLIAQKLKEARFNSLWCDSKKIIKTDSNFTRAEVNFLQTNNQILSFFQQNSANIYIFPGFIASNENDIVTTLGRGGSDYTASILASALHVSSLEIWTDVSGMMTADPRITNQAKVIPIISYQEALELCHFGAKVLYPPTIIPAMNKSIDIWIKNTFRPNDRGTLITSNDAILKDINTEIIKGITSIHKIALLSLEGSGMIGVPGFSKRLFEILSRENINVIFITQGSSEHAICVGIDENFVDFAKSKLDAEFQSEINRGLVEAVKTEKELSIVALVGDQMKNHTNISGRMFSALGRNGINIRAIAQGSSEKNISAIILTQDAQKAIVALHEAFFESTIRYVHLYIVGIGKVGSYLLSQLKAQQSYILEHFGLHIKVKGLAKSKNMLISNGVDDLLALDWKEKLEKCDQIDLQDFLNSIIHSNYSNSIFIDITADEHIVNHYPTLLRKSISIVACNKVAASSMYENYALLKKLSKEYAAGFHYETNVGAALPIIGSIQDLIKSGDNIHRIYAVLSGTLNFVFNQYDTKLSFSEVVKQAQLAGFTEPDPRLDLSGKDVMRKILILCRVSGYPLEITDVICKSFLPAESMHGNIDDFYRVLEMQEEFFKHLYNNAKLKNTQLRFVASFENGKAEVGLMEIDSTHEFYHLEGSDNVVLFYTDRYQDRPMMIKGAGAGAEITASGVFADILRASRI